MPHGQMEILSFVCSVHCNNTRISERIKQLHRINGDKQLLNKTLIKCLTTSRIRKKVELSTHPCQLSIYFLYRYWGNFYSRNYSQTASILLEALHFLWKKGPTKYSSTISGRNLTLPYLEGPLTHRLIRDTFNCKTKAASFVCYNVWHNSVWYTILKIV